MFDDAVERSTSRTRPTWRSCSRSWASVNAAGAAEKDAAAYIAFLDAQPQVDKAKKIGTQGYCMGGPLVVKTAATVPNRVGAGASFHGGGLVTDKPDSPHLLAPKIKARMYFGDRVERRHDASPTRRTSCSEAFAAANVPAEIEVYPALHGWCVPDMPKGANGDADLQQARRRARVGQARRALRDARLSVDGTRGSCRAARVWRDPSAALR